MLSTTSHIGTRVGATSIANATTYGSTAPTIAAPRASTPKSRRTNGCFSMWLSRYHKCCGLRKVLSSVAALVFVLYVTN